MQTTLQLLISHIEKCQEANFVSNVEYIKEKAVELLENEKQEILNAYKMGGREILEDTSWHNETFFENSEKYYINKFKND